MKRKKVGTITLALGLIIFGLALFADNFTDIALTDVYKYWPVLLIGLGIEIFVYMILYRQEENMNIRIDGLLIALVIIAAIFSINVGKLNFNFSPNISFNPLQGNAIIDGVKYKAELKETVIKDNVSKDFDISRLTAKNSFGDVVVQPHDKEYIKVEAAVRIRYNDESKAREYLNNVVKITEGEDTQIYTAEYNGINKNDYARATVDFVIYVPKDVAANVTNSFGDVNVQGLSKDVTINNQHGDVTAKDIQGNVTLKNSFGDMEANNIGGRLDADNQHGDIDAENINGSADIETGFGGIKAENISGKLIARNNYGKITARNVREDAEIKTSFGEIEVSDVEGGVIINNNNGQIQANEIKGNVQIRNSFGKIYYRSSNSGNADIYAKTSFGDIKTSLPVSVTKSINDQTAQGKTGNGQYRIELITNNGDIEIK